MISTVLTWTHGSGVNCRYYLLCISDPTPFSRVCNERASSFCNWGLNKHDDWVLKEGLLFLFPVSLTMGLVQHVCWKEILKLTLPSKNIVQYKYVVHTERFLFLKHVSGYKMCIHDVCLCGCMSCVQVCIGPELTSGVFKHCLLCSLRKGSLS